MSRNDWEHGTIKLPAGAMKRVRDEVISTYNAARQTVFELALAVLPDVLAAGKRKRNFDYRHVAYTLLERRANSTEANEAIDLLFSEDKGKPKKPKKKAIGLLPKRAESVQFEDACITFNADGRHVSWDVGENNRACEHAREHRVGRAFFRALNNVEWTRGSGGRIVGNDEYNQDNEYEGGGSNYVTARFGPLGKGEE